MFKSSFSLVIYHTTIFDALIQRELLSYSKNYKWKFMKASSRHQNDIIFNFLLKSSSFGQETGKFQKIEYLKNHKNVLGEKKVFLIIF